MMIVGEDRADHQTWEHNCIHDESVGAPLLLLRWYQYSSCQYVSSIWNAVYSM